MSDFVATGKAPLTTLPVRLSRDPKGKGAWYLTTIYECPTCGRGETLRERRYDEKPGDVRERYVFIQHWDGCNV